MKRIGPQALVWLRSLQSGMRWLGLQLVAHLRALWCSLYRDPEALRIAPWLNDGRSSRIALGLSGALFGEPRDFPEMPESDGEKPWLDAPVTFIGSTSEVWRAEDLHGVQGRKAA